MHETSRVFADRLIDERDRASYQALALELLQRYFKGQWQPEGLFVIKQDANSAASVLALPLLFSDILRLDVGNREYEEIIDARKLLKTLDDKLDEYNAEERNTRKMQLVFFE